MITKQKYHEYMLLTFFKDGIKYIELVGVPTEYGYQTNVIPYEEYCQIRDQEREKENEQLEKIVCKSTNKSNLGKRSYDTEEIKGQEDFEDLPQEKKIEGNPKLYISDNQ